MMPGQKGPELCGGIGVWRWGNLFEKHNIRSVYNHFIIVISQYIGDISYIC